MVEFVFKYSGDRRAEVKRQMQKEKPPPTQLYNPSFVAGYAVLSSAAFTCKHSRVPVSAFPMFHWRGSAAASDASYLPTSNLHEPNNLNQRCSFFSPSPIVLPSTYFRIHNCNGQLTVSTESRSVKRTIPLRAANNLPRLSTSKKPPEAARNTSHLHPPTATMPPTTSTTSTGTSAATSSSSSLAKPASKTPGVKMPCWCGDDCSCCIIPCTVM